MPPRGTFDSEGAELAKVHVVVTGRAGEPPWDRPRWPCHHLRAMSAPARSALRARTAPLLGLLAAAWAAATVLLFSDGAVSVYVDMLVLYLGAALLGVGLLVVLVAGGSPPGGGAAPRRWPWLVFSLLWLASVPSACRYGWPFKVRFGASRPALEAAAADRAGPVHARRIGLLAVDAIERADGVTRFVTGSCGLAELCGVAYSPGGAPAHVEGIAYKPLGHAGWWAFSRREPAR